MDWPANSIHMDPIEHVFDLLGRRVRKIHAPPANLQQLLVLLQHKWQAIPQANPAILVHSMRSHCNICSQNCGVIPVNERGTHWTSGIDKLHRLATLDFDFSFNSKTIDQFLWVQYIEVQRVCCWIIWPHHFKSSMFWVYPCLCYLCLKFWSLTSFGQCSVWAKWLSSQVVDKF